MSGADLIAKFGQTLTVRRKATGEYVNGEYQPGAESTFQAVLSVQPLSDKERINLPEGQRNKRILKGYSDTALQVADEATGAMGDRIEFDGTDFEVTRVASWPGDLTHWKVELAEVNR
ncbi:MAG TPA: hypothetical protein DF383_10530 [Deltaproteobacteria bacterium]|nr:hypothetical protein [Deltaproteobacteria bacterium]